MEFLLRTAAGGQQSRWGRAIAATMKAHVTVAAMPEFAHLKPEQQAALADEMGRLAPFLDRMDATYNPYRDFLSGAFVEIRALERVGDYLCDAGQTDLNAALSASKDEVARLIQGGVKTIQGGLVLSRVLRAGRDMTAGLAKGAATLLRILPETKFPAIPALATRLERAGTLLEGFLLREKSEIESQRPLLRANVRAAINDLHEALAQMNGRLRTHFSDAFIDSLYPELKDRGSKIADAPEEDAGAPPTPGEPTP